MRVSVVFLLAVCCQAALRRLEPPDGSVLHMAGQSPGEFSGYTAYLSSDTRPLGYTTYHTLASLNASSEGGLSDYWLKFRQTLDSLGDQNHIVLPHLSLALTPGYAVLEGINSGAYDHAISELVSGIPVLGRPTFLRIGYEFNGRWNNYTADAYVRAWRRIEAALAKDPDTRRQTALVWDMTCDERGARAADWRSFYPGDDVVDWWGVNVFQPGDGFNSLPNSVCVKSFVQAAESADFPVLIAEAMPRYIGTNSNWSYTCSHHMQDVCNVSSWNGWFDPFFDLLKEPSVKGFSYIDRDCTTDEHAHKCSGGQWGDARIETSALLGPKYAQALRRPGLVHAATLNETCSVLGVECGRKLLW